VVIFELCRWMFKSRKTVWEEGSSIFHLRLPHVFSSVLNCSQLSELLSVEGIQMPKMSSMYLL
jgi:hypothetical protein